MQTEQRQPGKMKFTEQEDAMILNAVARIGPKSWNAIAANIPNRTGRQIRERWKNYLAPNAYRGNWTDAEDQLLQNLVRDLGPKWSIIARYFQNRTDVCLKHRYLLLQRRDQKIMESARLLLEARERARDRRPRNRNVAQHRASQAVVVMTEVSADEVLDDGLSWVTQGNDEDLGSFGFSNEFDLEESWI
jgi:hypothetical protein